MERESLRRAQRRFALEALFRAPEPHRLETSTLHVLLDPTHLRCAVLPRRPW